MTDDRSSNGSNYFTTNNDTKNQQETEMVVHMKNVKGRVDASFDPQLNSQSGVLCQKEIPNIIPQKKELVNPVIKKIHKEEKKSNKRSKK